MPFPKDELKKRLIEERTMQLEYTVDRKGGIDKLAMTNQLSDFYDQSYQAGVADERKRVEEVLASTRVENKVCGVVIQHTILGPITCANEKDMCTLHSEKMEDKKIIGGLNHQSSETVGSTGYWRKH